MGARYTGQSIPASILGGSGSIYRMKQQLTVRELIEELEKLDGNLLVFAATRSGLGAEPLRSCCVEKGGVVLSGWEARRRDHRTL